MKVAEFYAGPAVGAALRLTFENLGMAFGIALPWLLFLAALQLVLTILFPDYRPDMTFEHISALLTGKAPVESVPLGTIINSVANLLAAASINVSWQRVLLLQETEDDQFFRLDWPVWRYTGNTLLLNFLCVAIGACVGVVITLVHLLFWLVLGSILASILSSAMVLFALFWIVLLSYRLSLKLPAVAIGVDDYGFGEAWADTRERRFGLLCFAAIMFCVSVAIFVVMFILTSVATYVLGQQTLATAAVAVALYLLAIWLYTIIAASSLSVLYTILVEGRSI